MRIYRSSHFSHKYLLVSILKTIDRRNLFFLTFKMGICGLPLLYAFINLLGSFAFGFFMTYPAPALPEMTKEMDISLFESTLFNSITSICAMVGAFLATFMIRFMGHKMSTFMASLFGAAISIALPFLTLYDIWFGISARGFAGIVVGAISAIIPQNIKIIAPQEYMSIYGPMSQFGITFGSTCCFFLSEGLNWKYLSFFCAGVCGLLCVLIWFVPLKAPTESSNSHKESVFQKKYAKNLIIAVLIMFFQQFSGINAIATNLNELFIAAGLPIPISIGSGIAASAQVIAVLIGGVMIYKFGRKFVWILSLFGSAALLILYALTIKFPEWPKILPIVIVFGYFLFFGIGLGPIPWFIIPEIFPASVASAAVSIGTMFNWICAFTVIMTFKYLVALCTSFGCMLIYTLICIAGGCFGIFFVTNGAEAEPEIVDATADEYDVYKEPALLPDTPEEL
ncbi:major facilitator superfamily transporter [Tritrichomonas foetus]|uniref:Major facilitator superfamily transporter n=1 Tax=Tritrichomonas foetus TaxID=1144522 RepID=A0A1J4JY13_9EUKA|nr:major facilitator superfamily transporter [Tritrichomonas foetus]|eukprot:OHT02165.1 major facilitator superfamily transporter [Tritrichomonas foetus]